jgi:predicted nuclease of predicted toxin-antitoxin system
LIVRWLADECIGAPLVASLRSLGHDVVYVAETAAGLSDTDVLALASRDQRILVTEDKDFGDLIFRRERAIPGLILIRLAPDNVALKIVRLATAIERYGEGLYGRYVVIEEDRFRSRRLPSES